jgi:hypothetical protein
MPGASSAATTSRKKLRAGYVGHITQLANRLIGAAADNRKVGEGRGCRCRRPAHACLRGCQQSVGGWVGDWGWGGVGWGGVPTSFPAPSATLSRDPDPNANPTLTLTPISAPSSRHPPAHISLFPPTHLPPPTRPCRSRRR